MSILIRMSAKDSTIPRNNSVTFVIEEERKEKVNFFLQTLEKEVKTYRPAQVRKAKKLLWVSFQTCVSLLAFVNPAFAATPATAILSPDLLDILLQLELLAVVLGVALAKLTFIGAGMYRILRKEKISREWTVDIIKGLVQILVAPIVVMTITYIVYFLFGNSNWFINPLEVLSKKGMPSLLPR